MPILSKIEGRTTSEREDIQKEIFANLENVLQPFLKTALTAENWSRMIVKIQEVFHFYKSLHKILKVEEIYNKYCSDFILEYDIDFSEGWFMYCHLRHQHLMIKFVPKEF